MLTVSSSRGRFARLCIQVNLEKPLLRKVMVGKLAIKVQYEGINSLCFACGRIGHQKEACPALIKHADIQVPQENVKSTKLEKEMEPPPAEV